MVMIIDPKTQKVTYSDPKKVEEFGNKLAQAMVNHLNKTTKPKKTPTK